MSSDIARFCRGAVYTALGGAVFAIGLLIIIAVAWLAIVFIAALWPHIGWAFRLALIGAGLVALAIPFLAFSHPRRPRGAVRGLPML